MSRVGDHDAIWGGNSGWNIENEAFSITKKTPRSFLSQSSESSGFSMTHCIPRCSIEIASFQAPPVYIVHRPCTFSKTSQVTIPFSGSSLLQVTRSPLFCPCSCKLVRLSHVPGFEAIFFPHIGPHDAAGFFYRLELGRRGDKLQSACNVSPLLSQKWAENERFGVEQSGTADRNGLRDLYTVEPSAYHRL